ncbi:MAG TPA: hypothetical protein VE359_04485 [Vicinamibacteria bacterium]|nr:hypothetical protein [Vicinamibacteria bacterium]
MEITAATLVADIAARCHAALREDLPRLGRMADKVAEVHGSRHPENNLLFRRVVSLQAYAEGQGGATGGTR